MARVTAALPWLMLIAVAPLPVHALALVVADAAGTVHSDLHYLLGLVEIIIVSFYVYLSSVYSVSATLCLAEDSAGSRCLVAAFRETLDSFVYASLSFVSLYVIVFAAPSEAEAASLLSVYWVLAVYVAAVAREVLRRREPGAGLFSGVARAFAAWLIAQVPAVLIALPGAVNAPGCLLALQVPPPGHLAGLCVPSGSIVLCLGWLGYLMRLAALTALYIYATMIGF